MSDTHLPEGWITIKFTDVLDVQGGTQPPKSEFIDKIQEGYIRLLQIRDFGDKPVPTFIPKTPKLKLCNDDDLLIGRYGASLGRICTGMNGAYNVALAKVIFGEYLNRQYLQAYLKSELFQASLRLLSRSAQNGFNKEDLSSFVFILSPFAEQKIIAEKLDSLLSQVEKTKARLEQIPEILKQFRQSVLSDAVSGKLTEDWRKINKQEPSFILQNQIKEYRIDKCHMEQKIKFPVKENMRKNNTRKDKSQSIDINEDLNLPLLPDGWVYESLDGFVYIAARIGWKGLKADEYTKKGPLFLSVHSLNYGKEVKLSEAFHISKERYDESPEIMLTNDDILLCKDGAGIGKLGIVKNLFEPATINSSLLLIRANKFFVPDYLYYLFLGPYIQKIVQERLTGTAVPHLFQRDIKEFVLKVPPLQEQNEIVRRVEQLFACADKIEQQANAALERVNNLTQSILAKAFRGELTAQWRAENPDLISGENSAEALLKKIREESKQAKAKAKAKKK